MKKEYIVPAIEIRFFQTDRMMWDLYTSDSHAIAMPARRNDGTAPVF